MQQKDETDPRNHDEVDEIMEEEERAEETFQHKLNIDTVVLVLLVLVFFACSYYYLRHHMN